MRSTLIAPIALLAACQVSSHVVPAGKDSYMVSSHVAGCISCAASVKSLETANAYCGKEGRVAIVRNSNSTTNGFGYEVGNSMVFSCVAPDDPEYARPNLRKDNGVSTIENR